MSFVVLSRTFYFSYIIGNLLLQKSGYTTEILDYCHAVNGIC